VKVALDLSRGVHITGYHALIWLNSLSEEEKQLIKKEHSSLLKGDLSTVCYKQLKYAEFALALELSASKTLEGKITLTPN